MWDSYGMFERYMYPDADADADGGYVECGGFERWYGDVGWDFSSQGSTNDDFVLKLGRL